MRQLYSEQQKNLRVLQSSKAKFAASLEPKLFKVLKGIGYKQLSYHGGSLIGKDIKMVIINATYLFGKFSLLLKFGKRDNCDLRDKILTECAIIFRLFLSFGMGCFHLQERSIPWRRMCKCTGNLLALLSLDMSI